MPPSISFENVNLVNLDAGAAHPRPLFSPRSVALRLEIGSKRPPGSAPFKARLGEPVKMPAGAPAPP